MPYIQIHEHAHTHELTYLHIYTIHSFIYLSIHTYLHTDIHAFIYSYKHASVRTYIRTCTRIYGVAMIGRLLKMIGLFCKRAL